MPVSQSFSLGPAEHTEICPDEGLLTCMWVDTEGMTGGGAFVGWVRVCHSTVLKALSQSPAGGGERWDGERGRGLRDWGARGWVGGACLSGLSKVSADRGIIISLAVWPLPSPTPLPSLSLSVLTYTPSSSTLSSLLSLYPVPRLPPLPLLLFSSFPFSCCPPHSYSHLGYNTKSVFPSLYILRKLEYHTDGVTTLAFTVTKNGIVAQSLHKKEDEKYH